MTIITATKEVYFCGRS